MSDNNHQQTEASLAQPGDQYAFTAQYYDLLYSDKAPKDIGFYLDQAGLSGGRVLELGCGTGRVTLPLAQHGFEVTGLDSSPAMLAQLESRLQAEPAEVRNRISLVRGDMADFDTGGKYGLVIVPFRAFQHLLRVEDQKSCLGCIVRELDSGGRFIFNAFEPNISYMLEAGSRDNWTVDVQAQTADGTRQVRRSFRVRHSMPEQIVFIEWRLEVLGSGGSVRQTQHEQMQLRWFYRYEVQHLLELSGFRIVGALADYDGTKPGNNCKELIYVCEAACND